MKLSSTLTSLVLAIPVASCAQTPTPDATDVALEGATEPAAPTWTWTDVELMGQRTLTREAILAEVDFAAGDVYETDFEGWQRIAEHLRATFGFADVKVSAVRFLEQKAYLVVDVIEAGDEHRLSVRAAPTGERPLGDAEVRALFARLSELRRQSFERGIPAYELADEGFLDFDDESLHAVVLQLNDVVPPHRLGLIEVLEHDADAAKRAEAATLLNWAGEVADSIARVHRFADDPDMTVRNNVTRFMLHYLDRVEDAEVRRGVVRALAAQLERPSHADRNKAAYGLLNIAEAFPEEHAFIASEASATLETIATNSILSNVKGPAQELLELIAAPAEGD